MTDTDDPGDRHRTWTLKILDDDDNVIEQREMEISKRSDKAFNADGFWKAVLLEPDGRRLRCVPLAAVVPEAVEAPPRLYIHWKDDALMECEDVPGFICAFGTEDDPETMFRWIMKNEEFLDRIAHWMAVFEERREQASRDGL